MELHRHLKTEACQLDEDDDPRCIRRLALFWRSERPRTPAPWRQRNDQTDRRRRYASLQLAESDKQVEYAASLLRFRFRSSSSTVDLTVLRTTRHAFRLVSNGAQNPAQLIVSQLQPAADQVVATDHRFELMYRSLDRFPNFFSPGVRAAFELRRGALSP